jgi:hypothetical protein
VPRAGNPVAEHKTAAVRTEPQRCAEKHGVVKQKFGIHVAGLRRILIEEYEKCITNFAIGMAQGAVQTGAGFFAGAAALLGFCPQPKRKSRARR